eukprot:scaffold5674_cov41-Prasinocladus_malaysianus.AAC.1
MYFKTDGLDYHNFIHYSICVGGESTEKTSNILQVLECLTYVAARQLHATYKQGKENDGSEFERGSTVQSVRAFTPEDFILCNCRIGSIELVLRHNN